MAISAMKTMSGYRFDEVFSSLQKCIRRGWEKDALYWAIELEPQFSKHLWNRLEIIAHEDISLGSIETIQFVKVCKDQYFEMRNRKNSAYRMVLANAILAMVRAPKSRVGLHFCNLMYRSDEMLPIPDVGKDQHTQAGRALGRGLEHFMDVGAVLENEAEGIDPYVAEARELILNKVPFKDDGITIKKEVPADDQLAFGEPGNPE